MPIPSSGDRTSILCGKPDRDNGDQRGRLQWCRRQGLAPGREVTRRPTIFNVSGVTWYGWTAATEADIQSFSIISVSAVLANIKTDIFW